KHQIGLHRRSPFSVSLSALTLERDASRKTGSRIFRGPEIGDKLWFMYAFAGKQGSAAGQTRPSHPDGERMPAPVRSKMERAFEFNFSSVRIHQDDRARNVG